MNRPRQRDQPMPLRADSYLASDEEGATARPFEWRKCPVLGVVLMQSVRYENILPLTSTCNLRCLFCSNAQNPPGVEVFSVPPLPLPLVRRLIPFLNPRRKIIIGEAASRISEGEPLTHPEFWKIVELVRKYYPHTPIQITTNGKLLNRVGVERLSELQPVVVNLSLNSATPSGRRILMGDDSGSVLAAASCMAELGVPYHGSIVACPHLVGWDDLRRSWRFLRDNGARTVRLFLPGFTRCAPRFLRFPPQEMYRRLQVFVQEEAALSATPLILEPTSVGGDAEPFRAEVEGVIPGSPAAAAGVRRGDVIKRVRGKDVRSRVEAYRLLERLRCPVLDIEGRGRVSFRKGRGEAPGVVMNYDIDRDLVKRLAGVIANNRAGNALLLTSVWGRPRLESLLPELCRSGAQVQIRAVPSVLFGGSIASAGLLTLSDFRRALNRVIEEEGDIFDLVLLPGIAFDRWGRDLLGRPWWELRRCTRGKVEIVT